MSDYKQTLDAAGNVTSQYSQMLQNLNDDYLAKQLRETTHMYQADCELKMRCAARIDELEFKLLSATMDGYDMAKHEYRDRIEQLEANLAKAVDALSYYANNDILLLYDDASFAKDTIATIK